MKSRLTSRTRLNEIHINEKTDWTKSRSTSSGQACVQTVCVCMWKRNKEILKP